MDDVSQSDVTLPVGRSSSLIGRSLNVSTSITSASSASALPPTLQVNGVEYDVAEVLPNKRGKSSWIWKEGPKLNTKSDSSNTSKPKSFWMCRRCHDVGKDVLYAVTSTVHASEHLRDTHQIRDAAGVTSESGQGPPAETFDFTRFKELLIRWIVTMHISFSQVEYEAFQSLLSYLHPSILSYLPTSGNTIRAWVLDNFKQKQAHIKKELHLSKSLVHFSFDMWTSPNAMAMLGIVAHYVSHSGEAKDCLIGLKRITGTHSGENIAQSVIAVIKHYGLEDRLGYFMLDNIGSNDTCVRHILMNLQPGVDPEQRRLRCFGHIINLAAKAFLFGKDPSAFEVEAGTCIQMREEQKELDLWRKLGPVGKLHNVVTYIQKTPQRREAFLNMGKDEESADINGKLNYLPKFKLCIGYRASA